MKKIWVAEEGFYRQNSAASIASLANADLITETVAPRRILKLTHYGTYAGDIGAWGKVKWSLRINQAGLFPFDQTTDQIGLQNQPVEISQDLYLPAGSILTVNAVNTDGGAAHTGIGFILKGEYGHFE